MDNNMLYFDDYKKNQIANRNKAFANAERRIKEKQQVVDDVMYELYLLKKDAIHVYKSYIDYRLNFLFLLSNIEKAKTWLDLKEKKLIDPRKKCDEKTSYKICNDELNKIFNITDAKIYDYRMYGYSHYADAIGFETQGHKFELYIPVVTNIDDKDYEREGQYVFQLHLSNCDKEGLIDVIKATFDYDELKDILRDHLANMEDNK